MVAVLAVARHLLGGHLPCLIFWRGSRPTGLATSTSRVVDRRVVDWLGRTLLIPNEMQNSSIVRIGESQLVSNYQH